VSVNEIAWLKVENGQRAAFAKQAHVFAKILADDGGCRHVQMLKGVENPDSFLFVITWDSRDAHKAFRESDRGRQAISTLASYLVEPPTSTHYKSLALPGGLAMD
jgi:quinol monooxygenase YgiN